MTSVKGLNRGKDILKRPSKKKKESAKKHGKNLIFCSECGIVYFNKAWHHNLRNLKSIKEDAGVKFILCPVCQMIKNNDWRGELIISNLSKKYFQEVKNLIDNTVKMAFEKNPLERIIKKEAKSDSYRVLVSENQLIHRLVHELKKTCTKVKSEIIDLRAEDFAKAKIDFQNQ